MRNRQLIVMGISLVLVIIFFLPWVGIQKGFDMFAESDGAYSGFTLVRGIHYAAPMVSSFGAAYGFPYASKLIYLGYLLWLIPILGIVAIVMSGIRKKRAKLIHLIQFVFTVTLVLFLLIGINLNEDIRLLYRSVLSTKPFFWMMFALGIAGIVVLLLPNKKMNV